MINSVDINSYPYKNLKYDLWQRGLNTLKKGSCNCGGCLYPLGVTLEYVVIDSPKITAVIYWAHYCVMGPVTAIYTFYLNSFSHSAEFYKRGSSS